MKLTICRVVVGLTVVAAAGGVGAVPAWADPLNSCDGGQCSGAPAGAFVEHCQYIVPTGPGALVVTPSPTTPSVDNCR